MERVLAGLQPEKYFTYFEELCRIPHSSYGEKGVSDYVVAFAKEHGLEVYQDAVWNVVINKPATPGYEDRGTIMLQAHLDMVCVADEGVEHDFTKDPLDIYIDGDWIRARGTTLGADNGTGVAMMLMLLDDETVPHPPIQCIFTTTEEVGMEGVGKLDPTLLKGSYLINLDGPILEEGLTLSCASAANHLFKVERELHPVENPAAKAAYKLTVNGLTSGHSGIMAHKCMGNAIKLLAGFLNDIAEVLPFELVTMTGGLKMNAIAKAAEAVILIDRNDAAKLDAELVNLRDALRKEYILRTDPEASLTCEETAMPAECYGAAAREKLLAFLDLLFDGTYMYMDDEKSMAKTSNNIGILSNIGTKVVGDCLMRSNSEYHYRELERKTLRMAKLLGVEHELKNFAPGWEYDPDTTLVKKLIEIYKQELGREPSISFAHGGMETGYIIGLGKRVGRKIEAMNMGVHNEDVHTTLERTSIASAAKTYDWIKKLLVSLN